MPDNKYKEFIEKCHPELKEEAEKYVKNAYLSDWATKAAQREEKERREATPALADGVTLTLSDVDKRAIRIERENDLVTFVKCADRLGNLNALLEIYPRHYTLEQIRDDLLGQRERIKNIILGPDR